MSFLMRGALVEYGTDLIGPIPNVVIFQFNPEALTRSFAVPELPQSGNDREQNQAGDQVYETISLKAHFSAADGLEEDKFLARTVGLGPQLAALEKMVLPGGKIAGLVGQAIDAIGDTLVISGAPTQPIPRQAFPRILFIWGMTRVHPVKISSMRISELEYDHLLNPVRAEVDLEIAVIKIDACSDDWLARGAQEFTEIAKETQAIANLANTAEQVVELIPL
ncbi:MULTISPECIES: hypothetical protein [Citricoccus]|uniref:hypothetical protein n=1 Tax=Citricoccus TaxID=169133 RepID=UPI000255F129|nr:hypothetical protein [Citricoccus sp. CH26A]